MGVADIRARLEQAEYRESTLFGTRYDMLNSTQIPSDGVTDSLALVRVEHPTFTLKDRWGKSPQERATFRFGRDVYDLVVTFSHELREDEVGRRSASDWWFTVSLGDEFPIGLNVLHYKLIAGALRIPSDNP